MDVLAGPRLRPHATHDNCRAADGLPPRSAGNIVLLMPGPALDSTVRRESAMWHAVIEDGAPGWEETIWRVYIRLVPS